jgi:hypothetical protein
MQYGLLSGFGEGLKEAPWRRISLDQKIIFIFQCLSDVHALNIPLDVHAMNGLNRAETVGTGWIVFWKQGMRTSGLFSAY